MKTKDTLLIGLMLFALFFGAGNLIYPPFLGMESGTSFWIAITGFIITGVGLPILAIAAIALVKDGAEGLASRVHPIFSFVFISTVYLAIGPLFAIPRGATVAFEIGLKPFVQGGSIDSIALLLFTVIFFGFVYIISLNPTKMVDRVGQWLTPALLLAIVSLAVASFLKLEAPAQDVSEKYASSPFFTGFIEGYLTMDTIASLAFGIIVINAIKAKGVETHKDIMRHTIKAGMIAGVGLAFVYVAIGIMGVKMASYGTFENGSSILSSGAELLFGPSGKLLLGFIVLLACFTTCIGLTIACSQYVTKWTTKISYKTTVTVIVLFSLFVSNLGLNQIITLSIPVLVMVYPITIVLVMLAFLNRFFNGAQLVYCGAIILTLIVSTIEGLAMYGLKINGLQTLIEKLPFFQLGLAWVVPALIGGIVGYILERYTNKKPLDTKTKHVA
ncbi:branched-chain amino acid transport system II carrier protein [Anaerobacillus isosaccharinicus]|uniref:Branched-chain amino acid transport system carrier protein n=1 Tax=Anaerobacillus isosaccharinicus TaxID=1532552 RepID=A0A1S2LMC5_9BACI|nr:branched-chain amino acid transport system II carrier protein [Anaerobacillus isosaccharinicus]MBA5586255.1 branched-chain amino acid transport system II carrier protein [Anaerobacillus isosaccharinicus]QOY35493.1 branched-chain amino acid transport system II carrier protein [Anaerobacillus isosaccharinicus]